MATNLTLSSRQFRRMLDLLVAEQDQLRKYQFWFRLHKGTFYGLVITSTILGLGILSQMPQGAGVRSVANAVYSTGLVSAQVAFFLLVPLSLMNLPFAWELLQQKRLRRQLGVETELKAMRETPSRQRWVMGVAAVGLGIISLVTIWRADFAFGLGRYMLFPVLEGIFGSLSVVTVALSVPLLWWTARAEDQMQEISQLRARLMAERPEDEAEASEFQVSTADYDQVAALEKSRALRDREASVRRGAKLASESIYAVQRSIAAQTEIMGLDSAVRLAVERTIFQLMRKPTPKQATLDGSTGWWTLPVADSSMALTYELAADEQRILIHELRTAGAGAVQSSTGSRQPPESAP